MITRLTPGYTRLILMAAMCLLLSSDAWAQRSDIYTRINATVGFPLAPEQFRERYTSGVGGGVTVGYLLRTGLEVTADLSVQRYLVDGDSITTADRALANEGASFSGGDAIFLSGMLGARLHLTSDSPVSGHLLFEGGFHRSSTTGNTFEDDEGTVEIPGETETAPIIGAGVGTTIGLTRSIGVYGQISYNIAFTEERVHYAPIKAGLIFRLSASDW